MLHSPEAASDSQEEADWIESPESQQWPYTPESPDRSDSKE